MHLHLASSSGHMLVVSKAVLAAATSRMVHREDGNELEKKTKKTTT